MPAELLTLIVFVETVESQSAVNAIAPRATLPVVLSESTKLLTAVRVTVPAGTELLRVMLGGTVDRRNGSSSLDVRAGYQRTTTNPAVLGMLVTLVAEDRDLAREGRFEAAHADFEGRTGGERDAVLPLLTVTD